MPEPIDRDSLAEMLEPWTYGPLQAPEIKVCCGQCGLTFGVASPAGDDLVGVIGTASGFVGDTRGREVDFETKQDVTRRPYLGLRTTEIDRATAGRHTYACHRRCGARYTVRADTLVLMWVRAAQLGASKIHLGGQRRK